MSVTTYDASHDVRHARTFLESMIADGADEILHSPATDAPIRTFRWVATSYDLNHIKRLTYACLRCGAEFKDEPSDLAIQLHLHASTPCEVL